MGSTSLKLIVQGTTVPVAITVPVADALGWAVLVAVPVATGVAVLVLVDVCVTTGVLLRVGVTVEVLVELEVAVPVRVLVAVGGVPVTVAVGVPPAPYIPLTM